ncbi:MAG: phospholipase [Deltaproteobacteria bacterium]|nr:phospholipase [Deltaproteobacteria bacterium]
MADHLKKGQRILLFFLLCALLPVPQIPAKAAAQSDEDKFLAATSIGTGTPGNLQGCPITLLANREYYRALKRAIDGAGEEIVMSFFLYKTTGRSGSYPDRILERLIAARQRGVRVKVVLEQGSAGQADGPDRENHETAEKLKKAGIEVVRDSPKRTTHVKLVVVDRRYTFLGSHNLTASALKYNNELSVLIESAAVAGEALLFIESLHP